MGSFTLMALRFFENPYVRSFHYVREIFTSGTRSFTGMPSRYYRPVMTFGYLLSYKVLASHRLGITL